LRLNRGKAGYLRILWPAIGKILITGCLFF